MSKHAKLFSLPIRVYFQDTDAGGVVYHASYLNFMERTRTEWLRSYGYSNAGLMKEFGMVFVVRSVKLDYLKPALLDDIGRSRISLLQTVRRGVEILTEAEIHLVCVSLESFRPVGVPEVLLEQWKN
jgi:acyl-CoA thioester hydrolase